MRLFVLLTCLGQIAWASVCPGKCKCSEETVDCSKSGLTHLPTELPDNAKTLIFRWNPLKNLRKTDVEGLKNLHTLILSHNRISRIEENILDALPDLKRLSLTNNRLKFLPPMTSSIVPSNLVSLDLRNNRIERIEAQALKSLRSLVQLDLAHNHIQSIPTTTFDELKNISLLRIHGNPWNCDCRINKLSSLIQKLEPESKEAICMNPEQLRGVPVHEVNDGYCIQPEVQIDNSDSSPKQRLKCPEQPLSYRRPVWLYRNIELPYSELEDFSIHDDGDLIVDEKEKISLISCAIDYAFIIHSRKVRKTRYLRQEPPSFTYKPKDNSYREGSEVKLNCEVMGSPKPAITWYYNGQRLTSNRKHEMSLANNVLRIYPFLESDVGRYTCAASNPLGRVEHTAVIELITSIPPNIYDDPRSQTVHVGGQAKFVCKARGTPTPGYTWSFDGSIIAHIKGRVMVSDDESELTINNVEKADEGVYSCMAGNPVGAMTAEAKLTVIGGNKDNKPVIDEALLHRIAQKARENVEKAVAKTRTQLSQDRVNNTNDLKRLFRFTVPAQAVELSKAREIYEESVRLVHEHVEKGMTLNVNELHPKNVSYEALLHVTHMQTLMGLSGCASGQFKNPCTDTCFHNKYRSFDGQCNNLRHHMWGVSQMPLARLLPPVYENGFNTPVGWEKGRLYNGFPLPNVREVSRQLVATETITPHTSLSSMVMQWGQFLDHDLTHTATALSRHSYATGAFCNRTCDNLDPCFNIPLSPNDPRMRSGVHVKFPCIEFERSAAVCGSGETSLVFQRVTYREQMNILTSYIDASNVYGSNEVQAQELRERYNDRGLLRYDILSEAGKPYLPFEKDSKMDCRRNFSEENPIRCFLAGDLRANEQLALTAVHTIFLREHNRIAGKLLAMNQNWDGEVIYHETRKIIGAVMQHITYNQWLPIVFGGKDQLRKYIGDYKGYDPSVDASVTNSFATAAFRFGHTIINPLLFRLDKTFQPIQHGHISLHRAFFTPELVLKEGGVDPLLRGLFASPLKHPLPTQLLNMELIEKLFHKGHEVALDLAVMNIQRSRDHGLPSYTEYRKYCRLSVPKTWDDMRGYIPDDKIRMKMKALYGDPANIDLWVGGIVEEKLPNALFGPVFACIIGEQFKRLRDGDRFWHENTGVFTASQLAEIRKVNLPRLLCDNGDDIDRVQKDIFAYPGTNILAYERCSAHVEMSLDPWRNCCDTICPTMRDNVLRSRHRGSRLHGCTNEGIWRPEGAKWSPRGEFCTECICTGSRVWCSMKEDCTNPFSL
ncbi:unnamed protein product [Caenorhabditis auriculariae]|uniref:Ig-like domain-containing protein n=1 Tax=Caenorhabditis auriculariae TaxID=2777116 RepID=A0A8S1H2G9_9PELO|nr:unnamed protein product [Caenorhabditis auriculariae]